MIFAPPTLTTIGLGTPAGLRFFVLVEAAVLTAEEMILGVIFPPSAAITTESNTPFISAAGTDARGLIARSVREFNTVVETFFVRALVMVANSISWWALDAEILVSYTSAGDSSIPCSANKTK